MWCDSTSQWRKRANNIPVIPSSSRLADDIQGWRFRARSRECNQSLSESEKENLLVSNLHHLEDGSVLGLNALQEAWLRQDELQALGRLQLVVGAGLWLLLDKLAEVALRSV